MPFPSKKPPKKRSNNVFSVTSLLKGFVHLYVPPSLADCCCCCKAYLFLCVDTPISYRQCFHPTAQNIQYTSHIYNKHFTTDTPNFIIISKILIIVAYALSLQPWTLHSHISYNELVILLKDWRRSMDSMSHKLIPAFDVPILKMQTVSKMKNLSQFRQC